MKELTILILQNLSVMAKIKTILNMNFALFLLYRKLYPHCFIE